MWVKEKLAGPGVKHHGDAKLGTEAIFAEQKQRFCSAREKKIEHGFTMSHRQRAQLRRKRENNVKVVDRQQPLEALVNPPSLRERLTLGTVSIAARVVRRMLVSTIGTVIHVPAKRCGAALLNGVQSRTLLKRERAAGPERGAMRAHHVREFEP
jgi:hypothetical protein